MALIVFLKGVNVGGHRTFRPSVLARQLAGYGVVNVGAAGTFVVRKPVRQAELRAALRQRLPFEAEAMISPGNEIVRLVAEDPFAGEACGPDIVRFVSVLAKRPRAAPALPLHLPPGEDWLVRVAALRGRFAIGLYRRRLRTIALFGQLEKHLGGAVTTRGWSTLLRINEILRAGTGGA